MLPPCYPRPPPCNVCAALLLRVLAVDACPDVGLVGLDPAHARPKLRSEEAEAEQMVWSCTVDVRGLVALPAGLRLPHLWTLPADCLLVEMSNGGLYAPGLSMLVGDPAGSGGKGYVVWLLYLNTPASTIQLFCCRCHLRHAGVARAVIAILLYGGRRCPLVAFRWCRSAWAWSGLFACGVAGFRSVQFARFHSSLILFHPFRFV